MKKVKLLNLKIRNFKGCESLEIAFNGSNTSIFAANEVGKSTIYSAVVWGCTGKDEFDRADYELKNTAKPELNHQPHEVELLFDNGGMPLKLKRVYEEKWVKPMGKSEKVFNGHTTSYWVNDVPCKLKDYEGAVEELIPASLIKLITNPQYFNSLPWETQRTGLLKISGGISNNEVIESISSPEHDYSTLIMVLNSGKSLEKYEDELTAKRNLLKKSALDLPTRIDEAERNKPKPQDWQGLQKQIDDKQAKVNAIDTKLMDSSERLKEKQTTLRELQTSLFTKESSLSAVKQKIRTEYLSQNSSSDSKIDYLKQTIQNLESAILRTNKEITDLNFTKDSKLSRIQEKQTRIDQLRDDWKAINAEKFEFNEQECKCPTCKQSLPEDDINKQREELMSNFNQSQVDRKGQKVKESDMLKTEVSQLQSDLVAINSQGLQFIEQLNSHKSALQSTESNLAVIQDTKAKKPSIDPEQAISALVNNNADVLNLLDEIKDLTAKIEKEKESMNTQDDSATETLKQQRKTLLDEMDEIKKLLALKTTIDNTDIRINELKLQEKSTAQEIADVENQMFEIESFTRAKMDILQNKVNDKFKYVSFRMFKKQVNGGLAETCVCEYKDVPYSTLNTAAKLLAGIDILNTLSNFYQITAFIFCDNRESCTVIPSTESQVISLYVSPEDKKLRIETE